MKDYTAIVSTAFGAKIKFTFSINRKIVFKIKPLQYTYNLLAQISILIKTRNDAYINTPSSEREKFYRMAGDNLESLPSSKLLRPGSATTDFLIMADVHFRTVDHSSDLFSSTFIWN